MDYSTDLANEAYITIRNRVLRGEIAIGQVISRRKMASALGMSFLPISIAFMRLELEGLLESKPRVGTRVRVPSANDVRGQYHVRTVLEQEAAKLFATLASPSERAELIKLAIRVDSLYMQRTGDRNYYLDLHETFHRRIAERSGFLALSQAIERTRALSSTWLSGYTIEPRMPNIHQDLANTVANGEPNAAGEAMREHVMSSMYRALQRLEPYFRAHSEPEMYSRQPRKQFARVLPDQSDSKSVDGAVNGVVNSSL